MKTVKLGDVVEKNSTIKWSDVPKLQEYLYIDLTSVNRSTHTIGETQIINSTNAPSRAQKIVRTRDVIFGTTRPTLNRLCIVNEDYDGQICSTGFCILRAKTTDILPSFIYYLLMTPKFVEYIEKTQRGTSYPAVTDSDVKDFQFALPSIEEQRRVVKRLDAAFEKIDWAIELTQKNIKNSGILYDNQTNELIFQPTDATRHLTLGSVVDQVITGPFGSALHKSDYVRGGVPVINPQNIVGNSIISLPNMQVSDETFNRLKRYELREGDIVIARRGEMGRCAVVQTGQAGWLCGTGSMILRTNKDALSEYAVRIIRTHRARDILEGNAIGMTMKNLNQDILLDIGIELPSTAEQQKRIDRLNNIERAINSLICKYQKRLTELNALKQSMLSRAFSDGGVE